MDVEPPRHRIAATPEQRTKPRALRLPALQARQQVVEPPRDIELRGICVELPASDLRAQALGHILRHRRNDSPQPSLRPSTARAQVGATECHEIPPPAAIDPAVRDD